MEEEKKNFFIALRTIWCEDGVGKAEEQNFLIF